MYKSTQDFFTACITWNQKIWDFFSDLAGNSKKLRSPSGTQEKKLHSKKWNNFLLELKKFFFEKLDWRVMQNEN